MKEVPKINVPMLVVHGSNDQRVPPEHFDKYIDELDRAGIEYQKLILEGADHFSNTLDYYHKIEFYEKMLDFFKNDCGSMSAGTSLANR
jgi:dipeptidyl aminopeptidase/acylaminoacyl peptidase